MTIPTKNNRYQNADSSSIYNIKQNLNTFLADFAELDFNNVVANGMFDWLDFDNNLLHWNSIGIVNGIYDTDLKYLPTTIAPSGSLEQPIHQDLRLNTNYSLILYGSAAVSGAIKVSVYSENDNQIYNINDEFEINSASVFLNNSVSGQFQKHILNFKSTAISAIEPPIYVKIENTSSNSVACDFKSLIVYSSLIELGDLPYYEDLPIQHGLLAGEAYTQVVFNNKGVAVSGKAIVHDQLCITDYITKTNYKFFVNKENLYIKKVTDYDLVMPLDDEKMTIQHDDTLSTYNIRIVYGEVQTVEIANITTPITKPVIIDDKRGKIFSMHVSGSTPNVYLKNDSYAEIKENGHVDVSTGIKYILEVIDRKIVITEIDSASIINTAPSASYKLINDLTNNKSYSITIDNGVLILNELVFDVSYSYFQYLKDFYYDIEYSMFIENGLIKLYQAYNPDLYKQLDETNNHFSIAISALEVIHSNDISALEATDIIHSNAISALEATDIIHSNAINALQTENTGIIVMFPVSGSPIPSTYLLCNGAEVSRATYVNLFNIIGTNYGIGDDLTTFNIPDLTANYLPGMCYLIKW